MVLRKVVCIRESRVQEQFMLRIHFCLPLTHAWAKRILGSMAVCAPVQYWIESWKWLISVQLSSSLPQLKLRDNRELRRSVILNPISDPVPPFRFRKLMVNSPVDHRASEHKWLLTFPGLASSPKDFPQIKKLFQVLLLRSQPHSPSPVPHSIQINTDMFSKTHDGQW